MKRTALTTILLLLFSLSLWAGGEVFLRPNFLVSYDTNVFSDPIPKVGDTGYLKRLGLGLYLDADYFFSEEGRTALSLSFLYSQPVRTETQIVGSNQDGKNDWIFSEQPDLYFAFGPMFRGQVGPVDLGIAIRLSVGSISVFDGNVNLGVQIEPYIMVPLFSDHWYLCAGFLYDAHFYDFLLDGSDQIYRDGYFLLTLGGYVGVTYRWGE